jgi:DNA-binding HxlR family transcriptional regulator
MPGPTRGDAAGPCPIGRAADVLGDRWSLLVLRGASVGTTRFDEFRAELGIADNVLADRLRRLVGHGLLSKVPYRPAGGGRTRHEYRLTPAGHDVFPVLHALMNWGNTHTTAREPVPAMRLVHSACGHDLGLDGRCPHCARAVPRTEAAWLRPWRADRPEPVAAD